MIRDFRRREKVDFIVFRIGNGGWGRGRRTVYIFPEIMTNEKDLS